MQAIARVNRVFGVKQGGLVVDYIGIAAKLKEALQVYTEQDKEQTGVDTSQAALVLLEKLDVVRELLHKHDYSLFFKGKHSEKLKVIMETIDFVLGLPKEIKDSFIKTVSELSKAYGLCATTYEAEKYNVEIGFFKTVRAGVLKFSDPDKPLKSIDDIDAEINQLISNSIKSDEVVDVLSEMGIKKPELSILSD